MFSAGNVVSCNLPYLPLKSRSPSPRHRAPVISQPTSVSSAQPCTLINSAHSFPGKQFLRIHGGFLSRRGLKSLEFTTQASPKSELAEDGDAGEGKDWTTSILLFCLWGALLYYAFNLSPNQIPSTDMYLLQKLLNLKGDDGFKMNDVLVSLWYIMGLWPLVYSMLLLPTGRSSKGSVPVWPFLVLSCFGGVYVLLPYFVLWKPPAPRLEESELRRWPLNFLESKLAAASLLAGGLGLVVYAALANADVWKEFYQYFRESRFIHVTSLDFSLLSAFSPFWVYNDMTSRKRFEKGFWLLPLSVIPFLGPALYLVLRPSLPTPPTSSSDPNTTEQEQLGQE